MVGIFAQKVVERSGVEHYLGSCVEASSLSSSHSARAQVDDHEFSDFNVESLFNLERTLRKSRMAVAPARACYVAGLNGDDCQDSEIRAVMYKRSG